MLTRLKVSGFKNLVDVDIRFGPFTCIAGANGVGKSNLFDAIRFLSALAEMPLIEAALSVRDEQNKTGDIRSLFHQAGTTYDPHILFEVEMIVPYEAVDELGQRAKASITSLRYTLSLTFREDGTTHPLGSLEIQKEELIHINRSDASKHFLFPHIPKTWRNTAIKGERRSPFISTEDRETGRVINLHQDGGSRGKPTARLASSLPRTILSATNAAESPTALVAREEMRSWRLLQLEPSALRKPDNAFTASTSLSADGSHLAATLYHLARMPLHNQNGSPEVRAEQVYAQVANRLSELIEDVGKVWVERDDRRELLTLMVEDREGTAYSARALSDGTLRFLALIVLELDTRSQGVLCLEEPENGIHPERIPKILELLQDIACDPNEEVGFDNPLRQVIINTHSPAVVQQILDENLIVAELKSTLREDKRFKRVNFAFLPDTWRQIKTLEPECNNTVSKGKLLSYLNPVPYSMDQQDSSIRPRRVVDRPDLSLLIPGLAEHFQ